MIACLNSEEMLFSDSSPIHIVMFSSNVWWSSLAGFSMEALWHLAKAFPSSAMVRGTVSGRYNLGVILKAAGM